MAHTVVKITVDDSGSEKESPKWCLSIVSGGDPMAACTGEYYGMGQSDCEYKCKTVESGGINCPDCLALIRSYKAIKL